jgi:alkylated DNA repair protein (DNA oxidative demethylase)
LLKQSGFSFHQAKVNLAGQHRLAIDVRGILASAPAYTPRMPRSGTPMSVRMSNCGPLGWFTDKDQGYRYIDRHPETGQAWPAIPDAVMAVWEDLSGYRAPPEACLINWYGPGAKLGLHIDQDEEASDAPVVSISLGDTAVFRVGGATRKSPTRTMKLHSGDVMVLGGESRHWYHGVDRVLAGSSCLLTEAGFSEGGRINLTLRRVTKP